MPTQDVPNMEGRAAPTAADHERGRALPMEVNGVVWLVEAAEGSRYHAVRQTSPKAGAFRDTALFLLTKLAKMDLRTILR